jgi:hypothetical protein
MNRPLLGFAAALVALTTALPAGAVRRCDILPHAQKWVDAHVMYSQGPWGGYCPGSLYCDPDAGGACYRPDCSGFVSAMWGLPAPGHTTYYFAGGLWNDGVSFVINKADLQPGDALNFGGDPNAGTGHIILFGGWLGGTRFWAYEENACNTPAHYSEHDLNNMGEYAAIRLAGIQECPTCGGAGAACGSSADCCTGSTCEHGACVGCPADVGNGCTWNGCGGAPACATTVAAETPAEITLRVYNETGAAWPAASTVLGTASGGSSPLASPAWLTQSIAVHPTADTAPSEAAIFVVPLYLTSREGVVEIGENLAVLVDGKATGAVVALAVTGTSDGGFDAAIAQVEVPPQVATGGRAQAAVELTNIGSRTWRAGRVVLGPTGDGAMMHDDSWPSADVVVALPSDVPPGQSTRLAFWLSVPPYARGPISATVRLHDADSGSFGPVVALPTTAVVPVEVMGGCSMGGRPGSFAGIFFTCVLAALILRRRPV